MASSATMFTLISSDDERFEVTEAAANMSQTIRHMIEDGCADAGIPLPNVSATILAKVLEFCNKHAAAAAADSSSSDAAAGSSSSNAGGDKELASFHKAFLDVDTDTLYDLLMAANYLEVKELLDLACQKVADMIRGKTPEQIRQTFGMKNDFSQESRRRSSRRTSGPSSSRVPVWSAMDQEPDLCRVSALLSWSLVDGLVCLFRA